jgi:predicted kinase
MATLHLIVGLPCAGKTTFAKQLELEQSALRLTPDEWHTRLFGQDFDLDFQHPEHDARHALIEGIMWDVAARALQLGTNVILDFGFWGKSEREEYRTRASQLGASSMVHFLNVPEQELLARLETRNANLPAGTFQIPASKLKEWMQIFQAPNEDELEHQPQPSAGSSTITP